VVEATCINFSVLTVSGEGPEAGKMVVLKQKGKVYGSIRPISASFET